VSGRNHLGAGGSGHRHPHGAQAGLPGRQAGRVLAPLLGILAVLAMGVAAVAIVLHAREREQRQATERDLQLALAENTDLTARLEAVQRKAALLEEQVAEARREAAAVEEQLRQAIDAKETLAQSLEDRQQQLTRLTQELEQVRQQASAQVEELAQLQAEREALQQHVTELEQARAEWEAKVAELSGQPTVELAKVLVTSEPGMADEPGGVAAAGSSATPLAGGGPPLAAPRPSPPSSGGVPLAGGGPPLAAPRPSPPPSGGVTLTVAGSAGSIRQATGQVVVVNREFEFVVINLGRQHGLEVGQEFEVVRDQDVLGLVKVEKVYDELSAAAILPASKTHAIREGDTVRAL
jgi:regulator of replication initiation timing